MGRQYDDGGGPEFRRRSLLESKNPEIPARPPSLGRPSWERDSRRPAFMLPTEQRLHLADSRRRLGSLAVSFGAAKER